MSQNHLRLLFLFGRDRTELHARGDPCLLTCRRASRAEALAVARRSLLILFFISTIILYFLTQALFIHLKLAFSSS